MKSLVTLGLTLIGLTALALLVIVPWPQAEGEPSAISRLVVVLGLMVPAYLTSVWLVLRTPLPRRTVWFVLVIAVAMRLPVLFTPPILSSDVYRYIWDGRVQLAGINPYVFVPADPALAAFRDEAIYPHINRADYAHTIYPPAAELVFAAIAAVSQSVFGEKLFMAVFEAVTIFCALRLLSLAGLPAERVLIYAWNPLAVWSFACDGHVDAVNIAFLAGALLLRSVKRDSFAGALLGAAVLVKFLPAVVGPALLQRRGGGRFVLAATVTILLLYAWYAGAGWGVFGFLSGYGEEEGLADGNGFWLIASLRQLVTLPPYAVPIYLCTGLLLLGAISCRVMLRPRPNGTAETDVVMVCGAAGILAACLTVVASPHYGWYFAWLALPTIVRPYRSLVWLSSAPVIFFFDPLQGPFLWRAIIYLPATVLVALDVRRPLR